MQKRFRKNINTYRRKWSKKSMSSIRKRKP